MPDNHITEGVDIMTTTGDEIRKARNWAGFTQVELAKSIYVSQSFLASLEAGRTCPSSTHMWRILVACNCEWLLTERGYVFIPGE